MVNTNLDRISFADGKDIPHGTKVQIKVGSLPGHARVQLKLPGRKTFADLGELPITDGTLSLPFKSVFLCHATEDQAAVSGISEKLFEDGCLVWFAPDDLLAGDAWKEKIDEALEKSNHVIVFLSNASCNKTGYFQREVKYAFDQRDLRPDGERYIIPVLLEDCDVPRRFRDIHWIKLVEAGGYEQLVKTLRVL